MATPINSFEIVESIRFFAQIPPTDGISQKAKDKANEYVERLLEALEGSIRETTALASGIKL